MTKLITAPRLFVGLAILAGSTAMAFSGVVSHPGTAQESDATSPTVFAAPPTTRSFADVVEQVSPAVVNVNVTKDASISPAAAFPDGRFDNRQQPFDDFFERFFGLPGQPQRSLPMHGQGSGFVIDQAGYIVTNNHVIDGASTITIVGQDGAEHDATLVGTDPKTDLAVLKIDADSGLPALRFGNSDKARVGDWVLAIGNPFGLGGTATAGIISARGRDIRSGPYDDFLQIDAPINSGNSGGPVFNAAGEVIGVNTAIFSPNGGNVGIGFAIPSSQVVAVVDELKANGIVHRGWLGVQIQDVDDEMARSFALDKAAGAVVADVVSGGPAAKAGIEVGDVIQAFDGEDIDGAKSLGRAVAAAAPNRGIPVRIWRDGQRKTLNVKLAENSEESQIAGAQGSKPTLEGELGMSFANITDDYRNRLGLPEDFSGVVITGVQPGSSAAERGLRPGDAISRIDTEEVHNLSDVARALKGAKKHGNQATLLVRRGDGQQFVTVAMS